MIKNIKKIDLIKNSHLYTGFLTHTRFEPKHHHFNYPAYIFSIDLDELENIDNENLLFSYNKWNIFSIWNCDYFDPSNTPIKEKALSFIKRFDNEHQIKTPQITSINLVTVPRYFNYVFNPISMFYCYDSKGTLIRVIAQVNNTFKEMHIYMLNHPIEEKNGLSRWECKKTFHVSPFFDGKGYYDFKLADIRQELSIQITYHVDGKKQLHALLKGNKKDLQTITLFKNAIKYPLTATLTMPRIIYQAFLLRFKKRLTIYKKPITGDSMTIRKKQASLSQRFYIKLVTRLFSKIQEGYLVLKLPDNQELEFGKKSNTAIIINILDYNFFNSLVFSGDIGFGEAYVNGMWTTDDLNTCLELFVNNSKYLNHKIPLISSIKTWRNKRTHRRRKNSKVKSKKNISYHYDVSNAFYSLFLDRQLLYSSALFTSNQNTLEDAQEEKMNALIKKAEISPEHHVLEIGTGWGAFAIQLVKKTKCRVTSVTISKEQYKFAKEKIQTAGLEDHITVLFKDYRDIKGKFDRIVSIEMIEAVGYQYLPTFFKTCDSLLTIKGKLVLQAIIMPDDRYKQYRKGCDWIQKHIFPGGHLPSIGHIDTLMKNNTQLNISSLTRITPHYRKTLEDWRINFLEKKDKILSLGFTEDFIRKWLYYFCYCETGFKTEVIDNFHIVCDKFIQPPSVESLPEIQYVPLYKEPVKG